MLYDSREYADYSLERERRIASVKEQNEMKDQDRRRSILESRENRIKIQNEYTQFRVNVKQDLLIESINYIFETVLNDSDKQLGKYLVREFVIREGADELLNKFASKTYLLANISNIINESFDSIFKDVDKEDPNTFNIKPSVTKDFYKELDGLDITQVTEKINDRVCAATEEFVQNNINDKLDMEDAAERVKERIDSIKKDDSEEAEEIKQEYANMYRSKINEIQSNRKRNIYEQMVSNATRDVVQNESMLNTFTNESGKLDIDSVINKTDTVYRFLETVNTLRIKDINKKYIEDLI